MRIEESPCMIYSAPMTSILGVSNFKLVRSTQIITLAEILKTQAVLSNPANVEYDHSVIYQMIKIPCPIVA